MNYPAVAPSNVGIHDVRTLERFIEVDWDDDTQSKFHHTWLRDNCPCELCHDPQTHQKMIWLIDIPKDIAPETVDFTTDRISIIWNNGGHESHYDAQWLKHYCYNKQSRAARKFKPTLWDASNADGISEMDYRQVAESEEAEFEMLELVRDHGFVLLRNVPVDVEETEKIGRRFGYPAETNEGVLIDIVADPNAANIAFTDAPVAPHADDTYRYNPPGIEMFHCHGGEPEFRRRVILAGWLQVGRGDARRES